MIVVYRRTITMNFLLLTLSNLPSEVDTQQLNIKQWKNSQLVTPGTRQITTEKGIISTSGGAIESFTYNGKAARLLTYQGVQVACGSSITNVGNLDNCNYLLENTNYEGGTVNSDYWLESPYSVDTYDALYVYSQYRYVNSSRVVYSKKIRPAITVLTSNIEY